MLKELITCEGPGILCAIAAAFPVLYLQQPASGVQVPSERLEFDMRGRMDVARQGEFAYVDVGEVKRSQDYASAVQQLGIRLGTLGWFVSKCCGVDAAAVRLVGRLFVPTHSSLESFVEGEQRDIARDKWNYSLYLHRI